MTTKEKQILLRDLCARLPYGVYVDAYSWQKDNPKLLVECVSEYVGEEIVVKGLAGRHSIKEIKPYLRSMSSMTEEEFIHYSATREWMYVDNDHYEYFNTLETFDWLNAHHFDFRGLIPWDWLWKPQKTCIKLNKI